MLWNINKFENFFLNDIKLFGIEKNRIGEILKINCLLNFRWKGKRKLYEDVLVNYRSY